MGIIISLGETLINGLSAVFSATHRYTFYPMGILESVISVAKIVSYYNNPKIKASGGGGGGGGGGC
mgnify:CR=1 FL=1